MDHELNKRAYPRLTDINQHGHFGIRTGTFSTTEPPGKAVEGRRRQRRYDTT